MFIKRRIILFGADCRMEYIYVETSKIPPFRCASKTFLTYEKIPSEETENGSESVCNPTRIRVTADSDQIGIRFERRIRTSIRKDKLKIGTEFLVYKVIYHLLKMRLERLFFSWEYLWAKKKRSSYFPATSPHTKTSRKLIVENKSPLKSCL